MKTLLAIIVIFLLGCTADENEEGMVFSEYETSPAKACSTNEECWCKFFDGAEFKNEREISKCCLPGDNSCTKPGYCVTCLYD